MKKFGRTWYSIFSNKHVALDFWLSPKEWVVFHYANTLSWVTIECGPFDFIYYKGLRK